MHPPEVDGMQLLGGVPNEFVRSKVQPSMLGGDTTTVEFARAGIAPNVNSAKIGAAVNSLVVRDRDRCFIALPFWLFQCVNFGCASSQNPPHVRV